MERAQVPVLLKNLFRLIRATNGQPVPSLVWLGEAVDPIKEFARRPPALAIEGLENQEILTNIPTLRKLLDAWLELQPKSTRGFSQVTRSMSEYLAAGGQRVKMQLIAQHYPNTLGSDNSCDFLESVTDFFNEVRTALDIVENRLQQGLLWVTAWDHLNSILSNARSLLPQVQLLESPKAEMLIMARNLIKAKNDFWLAFTTWITTRVNTYAPPGKLGLAIVRTLLSDIVEMGGATFDQITAGLREYDHNFVLAFLPGNPINADNIPSIKIVWAEINALLRDVAHCGEQKADKHEQAKGILISDIDGAVAEINSNHKNFTGGERSTWIQELTSMAKRLDILRQDGYGLQTTG